jgi:nicotinamidase-related amidase
MDADRKLEVSPESSALVIVDMQAEGCERHGPTLKPIIKNIRGLLDRFRDAKGNVVHVQSVREKNHPEFTVFGKEYSLIENTPAVEFIEELKPLPDEIVVQKFSHDCFYQTTMKQQLRRLDLRPCRDQIIVTGIGSNNCVYHTVIGFHVRNFFVIVPEDCIHASRADGQQFALTQFRSSAYNFNVTVNRSTDIRVQSSMRQRASV